MTSETPAKTHKLASGYGWAAGVGKSTTERCGLMRRSRRWRRRTYRLVPEVEQRVVFEHAPSSLKRTVTTAALGEETALCLHDVGPTLTSAVCRQLQLPPRTGSVATDELSSSRSSSVRCAELVPVQPSTVGSPRDTCGCAHTALAIEATTTTSSCKPATS